MMVLVLLENQSKSRSTDRVLVNTLPIFRYWIMFRVSIYLFLFEFTSLMFHNDLLLVKKRWYFWKRVLSDIEIRERMAILCDIVLKEIINVYISRSFVFIANIYFLVLWVLRKLKVYFDWYSFKRNMCPLFAFAYQVID